MIHPDWGWLALVGGVVLVPAIRPRRLAAGGLGALALALGALRVGDGGPLPGDFAAVELALVLLGAAVLAAAVLPTVRGGWRGALAAALLTLGVVLLLGNLRPLAHAPPLPGTAAALGVVAGIVGLGWAGAGLVLRRLPASGVGPGPRTGARWTGCAAAGVILTAIGPSIPIGASRLTTWESVAASLIIASTPLSIPRTGAAVSEAGWMTTVSESGGSVSR